MIYIFCFRNLYGAGWLLAEGTLRYFGFVLSCAIRWLQLMNFPISLAFGRCFPESHEQWILEIKTIWRKGLVLDDAGRCGFILLGFISFIRPVIMIQIIGINMGRYFWCRVPQLCLCGGLRVTSKWNKMQPHSKNWRSLRFKGRLLYSVFLIEMGPSGKPDQKGQIRNLRIENRNIARKEY